MALGEPDSILLVKVELAFLILYVWNIECFLYYVSAQDP